MTQNQKLVAESVCGSDDPRSEYESQKLHKKGSQKICVNDNVQGETEHADSSFVVDMEGLSHLIENDMNVNSGITLQRNLTRKASMRGVEKKTSGNEMENTTTVLMSSPRATLVAGSMPEKIGVVGTGPIDHAKVAPQVHHQITITSACMSAAAGKGFGSRRSSRAGFVDSRKIFFFFATLSCMGTMMLIYFTLSMGKFDGGDGILD